MLVQLKAKDRAKAALWAVSPLFLAMIIGSYMGVPYGLFAGLALMGLLVYVYNCIGGIKKEIFMGYTGIVLFFLAMAIGGWADSPVQ